MIGTEVIFFCLFIIGIVFILALDLGLFSTTNKSVSFKEAGIWSGVWVTLALGFFMLVRFHGEWIHGIENMRELVAVKHKYHKNLELDLGNYELALEQYRKNSSIEFLTGYVIEYALSVDNIFVIILIFNSFGVRERYYKKVLFWGILGAIIMRFAFIFLGSALLQQFTWVLYIFGAFLAITGLRMFFDKDEDDKMDTDKHPVVRLASRYLPLFPRYVSHHFFIKKAGRTFITPLFMVLLIIEFTDLIFAVDSVPAVFAVTQDPQLVFFSNIFAILGLRSMFFFLTNIMHLFHYLKTGLAVLLVFIGVKMLAHHWLEAIGFTNLYSLVIIVSILAISVVASLLFPKRQEAVVE